MTRKTQWTPGPWAVQRFREGVLGDRAETMRERISIVRPAKGNSPDERIAVVFEGFRRDEEADARLISAAPEMYEALSAIADLARSTVLPSGQPALCRALLDIEGIARAVLSKAEGR